MSDKAEFVDILLPRHTESGIFHFMSRAWMPKKCYEKDKYYTPQELKDAVSNSSYMDAIIEAQSASSGVKKEQLREEMLKYLEEMGMDKKLYIIRWTGIVFLKLCFMMKVGVFVNEATVLNLKNTMGNNPVLFLPTHRSYADFCLMTYLCYHYDIDFPAVAAGMDFYSMAVVGRCLRDICAFYIRRTLVGAPLYAATLKQYVRTVVAKHHAPVEFFLEGTRSRGNKSLPPKYGMLSMTLMPLFAGEVTDITIVPINISYDRLMEHGLFAYEHLGVPKPKESTGGLLKAIYQLNENFGNIYIKLGEPISARQYIRTENQQKAELLKPIELQNLTTEQFSIVQDLADMTVAAQQDCTIVTTANLLAVVLMQSIIKHQPLMYDDFLKEIEWVTSVLRKLGATIHEVNLKEDVDRILVVHNRMVKVDNGKMKLISSAPMEVSQAVKDKMKGHTLAAETMVNAVPVIQLQLYVNTVSHYFVPSAIICLIAAIGDVSEDQFIYKYHTIRKLLKHEFFFLEKQEEKNYADAFDFCIKNGIISRQGGYVVSGSNDKLRSLLEWMVWPALTSLVKCADIMREKTSCDHKTVLKHIQERVEASNCHPYCLSLEATTNCLQGLVLAGALRKVKSNDKQLYELTPTMNECYNLVTSILPTIQVNFDINEVILDHRVFPSRL